MSEVMERVRNLLSYDFDAKPYSGRGMYGKNCLSVTTEDQSPLRLLADIVRYCADTEDAYEILRGAEMDSMGRDTVIYWPCLKVSDHPE